MIVHVDETGRDGQTRGVNGALGGAAREMAHGDDAVVPDSDVAEKRRIARAIHDAAAANQQIEILREDTGSSEE